MNYEKISEKELNEIKSKYYKNFSKFEKRFFNNFDLLIARANKLKDLKPGTLDYWTYYDATLTQIRAMFIETPSRKKNYTFQNYLINIGQVEISKEIDNYLDKHLYENISFRDAVKVSVDKFIVHYDKVSTEEVTIEQKCRAKLTESNNKNCKINNILIEFMKLLLSGMTKAWENYYTHIKR